MPENELAQYRMEVWKPNLQVQTVQAGRLLRIRITKQGTAIVIEFVNIPMPKTQKNLI
jgi:hypothetical protein